MDRRSGRLRRATPPRSRARSPRHSLRAACSRRRHPPAQSRSRSGRCRPAPLRSSAATRRPAGRAKDGLRTETQMAQPILLASRAAPAAHRQSSRQAGQAHCPPDRLQRSTTTDRRADSLPAPARRRSPPPQSSSPRSACRCAGRHVGRFDAKAADARSPCSFPKNTLDVLGNHQSRLASPASSRRWHWRRIALKARLWKKRTFSS